MSDAPPTLAERVREVPVTAGLVALLVAVFGLLAAAGGSTNVNSELITRWGANTTGYTPREPWRIVTAAFLHYNVVHVLFNGYALWFVGGILERALGGRRLLALFVLFAIGGNVIGSLWWEARLAGMIPGVPGGRHAASAGASGAVCGLVAYAALYVRAHESLRGYRGGMRTWLIAIVVISFAMAKVDAVGHLGGMLAGAVGAASISPAPGTPAGRGWTAAAVAAGLLAVACFGLVAAEVRIG